jgi:membrane protein
MAGSPGPIEPSAGRPAARAQPPWRSRVGALHREWRRNRLGESAAALAFYVALALFPFLLFVVALAGTVLKPGQVQAVIGSLGEQVPSAFSHLPDQQIAALTGGGQKGLLTFSGVGAIWSATAGVVSLISALNSAYGVEERRPRWRVYSMSLVVMVAGALLALAAGFLTLAAPALATRLGAPWPTIVAWGRLPVAVLLMMVLWATLYTGLPDTRRPFQLLTPGAVIGVLIWLLASLGFSVYLAHFSTFGITYGALGGIVVLLLWIWISSLALVLGAAINRTRDVGRTQRDEHQH